jgi:uncharacterized protein (TIGR02246 family)
MTGIADFQAAVAAKYALHEQAFADHDAAPIADAFYSDDADWAFQGYAGIKGRDAIRAFYDGVVTQAAVAIEPIDAAVDGDGGWSLCDYHVRVGSEGAGEQAWTYRTVYVWRKTGDDWLVRVGSGVILA